MNKESVIFECVLHAAVSTVWEAIPRKRLVYSWTYEGYSGSSCVTFELSRQVEQTLLKLTHAGIESFLADKKELAKSNFVAGWNHIIGNSLSWYLHKAAHEES